jgi:hypothetical protein
MLAVVQHEKRAVRAKVTSDRDEEIPAGICAHVEQAGDVRSDLLSVAHRKQIDEPDVVVRLIEAPSNLKGNARFPDATASSDRQQAILEKQPCNFTDFGALDE